MSLNSFHCGIFKRKMLECDRIYVARKFVNYQISSWSWICSNKQPSWSGILVIPHNRLPSIGLMWQLPQASVKVCYFYFNFFFADSIFISQEHYFQYFRADIPTILYIITHVFCMTDGEITYFSKHFHPHATYFHTTWFYVTVTE